MPLIEAAIVGLGRWGRTLVASVQGKCDRLRFTHAVSRDPARVGDFAAQHGLKIVDSLDAALAEPGIDAIVLATFRNIQFATLLSLVASVLRRGSWFRRHRSVDYRTDLASAVVTGHGPFPYQVDGDHLGDAERLEFRHEPDALTIVVP